MGIETWGCFIEEISIEDIQKILPDYDIKSLTDRLAGEVRGEITYDSGIEDCFDLDDRDEFKDEDSEESRETLKEYRRFQKLFKKATRIRIYFGSHDAESSGNRGDEVDGTFWHLDDSDIYSLTPRAKKLLQKGIKIEHRNYTIWG